MKKLIVLSFCFLAFSMHVEGQIVKFGIKAGANFSNLDGNSINSNNLTSYHVGIMSQIKVLPNFAIQPEALFSSQGAKVDGANDFELDYVAVPVLAKFYLITDVLSLEAGPQFSFLVNSNLPDTYETQSFDFGAAGGLGLNITKSFVAQARYVVGLSDTSRDAEITNRVFQISLGYFF